jgi:hypothetical protein
MAMNFVIKTKRDEPSFKDIKDQEIETDLKKADLLIKDINTLDNPKRRNTPVLTEDLVIKKIPFTKTIKHNQFVDINKLLDSLDSKHNKLIGHFSPQRHKKKINQDLEVDNDKVR